MRLGFISIRSAAGLAHGFSTKPAASAVRLMGVWRFETKPSPRGEIQLPTRRCNFGVFVV